MSNNFSQFKQQIDQALNLVESASVIKEQKLPQLNSDQLIDTQSLLDRCEQVCDKYKKEKPTIRIIHHLACSGGTLISKCISAMPNVYLLSEVHPFTDLAIGKGKPKYSPTDLISLVHHAKIPQQKKLAGEVFKASIKEIHKHILDIGGILVLRDHTHADYCTNHSVPEKSRLVALLEDEFDVRNILTARDPIDSFSSLEKNNWVHFSPENFEEYCHRVQCLLEQFEINEIFQYEAFVNKPLLEMKNICQALSIPFDDGFEYIFDMFKVTGDSGRSSNIIAARERKASQDKVAEYSSLEVYDSLIRKYFTQVHK